MITEGAAAGEVWKLITLGGTRRAVVPEDPPLAVAAPPMDPAGWFWPIFAPACAASRWNSYIFGKDEIQHRMQDKTANRALDWTGLCVVSHAACVF